MEVPKPHVAGVAKQPTDLASLVTVIDKESLVVLCLAPNLSSATDSATAALGLEHGVVGLLA